jgi:hypothetical protein
MNDIGDLASPLSMFCELNLMDLKNKKASKEV